MEHGRTVSVLTVLSTLGIITVMKPAAHPAARFITTVFINNAPVVVGLTALVAARVF